LFSKDFIIVPINESSHWYLAIICYPGLVSSGGGANNVVPPSECPDEPVTEGDEAEGEEPDDEPAAVTTTRAGRKTKATSAAAALASSKLAAANKKTAAAAARTAAGKTAVSSQTAANKPSGRGRKPAQDNLPMKKRACILIFDSLAGPARSGVVRVLREYLQVEWNVKKSATHGECMFSRDTMLGLTPVCPQQSNFSDCGLYVLQYVKAFYMDPIEDYSFRTRSLVDWFDEAEMRNKRAELQRLILDLQRRLNPTLNYDPSLDGCLASRAALS